MSIKVVEHHGDGKTLEQVREATAKLRADILQRIREFETQTGCHVADIRSQGSTDISTGWGKRIRRCGGVLIEIDAGF